MNSATKTFLWLSAEGGCCFLIPAGSTFRSGTYPIVNYDQGTFEVEEESIRSFEVDRERALKHMQDECANAGERFKETYVALSAFCEGVLPAKEKKEKDHEQVEALVLALLGEDAPGISNEQKHELQQKVNEYLAGEEVVSSLEKLSDKLDKLKQELKTPLAHGNNLKEIITSLAASLDDDEDKVKKEKRAEELKKPSTNQSQTHLKK